MPRPQFRLRLLFVLIAVVAALFGVGCLAWHTTDAQYTHRQYDDPEMVRAIFDWAVCYYVCLTLTLLGVTAFGLLYHDNRDQWLAFLGLSLLPAIVGFFGEIYGSNISYSGNAHVIIAVALPAISISFAGTGALLAIGIAGIAWNFLAAVIRRRPDKPADRASPPNR
jgi:hypothetical protein